MLGCIGLMVGLHSSAISIVFGALLFHCVLIVSTLWTVVVAPESAFNLTSAYFFGALTGPFEHRNILGAFLGLGMAALLPRQRGTFSEAMRTFLFAVSSVLLIATQSLTPVLALCAASLYVAWRLNREKLSGLFNTKTKTFRVLLAANGVLFVLVVVALLPQQVITLRRSLGGRVRIWEVVVQKLLEEFPFPPAAQWITSVEVVRELGYNPVHAHNALLSLFLIYGILPTIVFVAAIMCAIAVSLLAPAGVRRGGTNETIIAHGLLVYMVIHGTAEPAFLAGPVGALLVGALAGTVLAPKSPVFR
jgi:hypothetical protein